MTTLLPLPGVKHGSRIMISVIEQLAEEDPDSAWASVPIDEGDLSNGYRDLTYQQLNDAANRAGQWLRRHLPAPLGPFQCFAYTGPNDLRYAAFAVAAGKLQKVMIVPSPLVTPEAQLQILEKKACTVYLRPASMAASVAEVLRPAPNVTTITVPELKELFQDTDVESIAYSKSWEEGMNDPWLVFHTSGTTGNPKPITYTHKMMAMVDIAASLESTAETHIHQFALKRWYLAIPLQHYAGIYLRLGLTSFLRMIAVRGPLGPPSPETIIEMLQFGDIEGAVMTPSLIDVVCLTQEGLNALRKLRYIHYAGAPLPGKAGKQLASYVTLVPSIGSTEAGGYFTEICQAIDDWNYIAFQAHAGAHFEPWLGELHELVFIRHPGCMLQQIFLVHPDRDRFETKDLWVEHPHKKGLWKIVGRTDDYVCLSHGDGLHASKLEPEIEDHKSVKAALIGGHNRPSPVLLIELLDDAQKDIESPDGGSCLIESLQPYIDRVNAQCHPKVRLSLEMVIFTRRDKPFTRTIKGSVARMQSLRLYEPEIAAFFEA